jgi:hypothetical protein
MATIRIGLVKEVVVMAFDTVRTNKMRSGLTVLGIVIGITAIVGMTALIRGFDQSVRDLLATIGPNTIFVQRFGITDFVNGAEIRDLLKRPNLTVSDARALENEATTLQYVDLELGGGVGPTIQQRVFYRTLKTKMLVVLGGRRVRQASHSGRLQRQRRRLRRHSQYDLSAHLRDTRGARRQYGHDLERPDLGRSARGCQPKGCDG